jgi:hypothetical protein
MRHQLSLARARLETARDSLEAIVEMMMHGVRRRSAIDSEGESVDVLPARRPMAGTIGLVVVLVAVASRVDAHVVLPRLQATRRLVLDLGAEPSLAYSISLGPRQSFLARQEADDNHDGEVDASEASALVHRFADRIGREVELTMGSPAPRHLGGFRLIDATSFGLVGPTGETLDAQTPQSSVQCSWAIPIDDGIDRLAVRDAVDFEPFEHTELEVRDTPARRFVGIGVDEQHLSASPHLAFVDEAASRARVVWIVFQPAPRRRFPFVGAAIGVVVLALLVVFARATRRRVR